MLTRNVYIRICVRHFSLRGTDIVYCMVLEHSDRKNSSFLKQEKISSGPFCVIIFLESKFF